MSSSSTSAAAVHPIAAPPYLILFVGALVAIGPLSIDMYLPAVNGCRALHAHSVKDPKRPTS